MDEWILPERRNVPISRLKNHGRAIHFLSFDVAFLLPSIFQVDSYVTSLLATLSIHSKSIHSTWGVIL